MMANQGMPLTSRMMSVAHMPNRLHSPKAASTDRPTIMTPVRPNPTLLYTSTAQDEDPTGRLPSARAMYSSITR